MTSFFDKLSLKLSGGKLRGSVADPMAFFTAKPDAKTPAPAPPAEAPSEEEILQSQRLDVDVFQDAGQIIIYALAAGVDPNDFDITLDEENDMLSIRGVRKRPERPKPPEGSNQLEGKFVQQECSWEPFFRKIVLPGEVDIVKAEAVFRKGVLIVTLPLLKLAEGRKLKVVEILSAGKGGS